MFFYLNYKFGFHIQNTMSRGTYFSRKSFAVRLISLIDDSLIDDSLIIKDVIQATIPSNSPLKTI